MQIKIAGTDRTGVVDLASLSLQDAVGERSVCRFNVTDVDGSLSLARGQAVEVVYDDGTKLFGGTVDRITRRQVGWRPKRWVYAVECVDWHQLADRRIVVKAYQNQAAGAIVQDLLATYLAGDGVAAGNVQSGSIVTEAVFNYVPVTRALDALAEFAGFAWWIDAEKKLYFVPRETYAAPWDLTEDRADGIEIDEGREGYRNRQYIKAGTDMTDPQTETRKGDGNTKAFAMGFPLAKVPTVKVNTVTKTVGIKGVDTGKDWYWSKGDPVVVQDQAATPLSAADTLEVTYQGLFNVVALSEDAAAIQERKTVEGGTGYYEAVDDEPHLSTRQAAFESAAAKLRRYARLARTITFQTVYAGLRPGQLLTVCLPDRGIDGERYLIEETELSYLAGGKWLWRVKAVSGEALGGWVKFFKDLAGRQIAIRENISENQVLTVLVSASAETWRWTEVQTVTVWACPTPSSTLYPSTTLYPC